ncbi:arabinose-binding domain of AraC transcription regulator, N-term family protein [Mycobacteroides abscessus MAB_082312_2258]|nr:arabinose-binding domain of AraC transcription regulator, N-term family protein [Mycobacteroides abscessus MAB_082312_2258]
MAVIRGSALTNYHELVAELGGDGSRLLAGARVSPTDAGSYERFISLPNGARALEATAAALNAPDFGRQLARRQGIEILGPVGLAARTAATVADAFAILEKFMGAYCPVISARVTDHRDPALCRFEFEYLLNPAPPQAQAVELSLGSRCGCCITFWAPVTARCPFICRTKPSRRHRRISVTLGVRRSSVSLSEGSRCAPSTCRSRCPRTIWPTRRRSTI